MPTPTQYGAISPIPVARASLILKAFIIIADATYGTIIGRKAY